MKRWKKDYARTQAGLNAWDLLQLYERVDALSVAVFVCGTVGLLGWAMFVVTALGWLS